MKNKKGASQVMWIIVVMALALTVLIILLIVTGGSFSDFFKGAYNCENKGGICKPGTNCGDKAPMLGLKCPTAKEGGKEEVGQVCCAK